jgi:hypothetical protein
MFLLNAKDENQRNHNFLIFNMVAQKGVPLSVVMLPFLTLNAETGYLKFKETEFFKMGCSLLHLPA